jgi:diguanylate cyclase (GGDEF)-like protein
VTDPLNLIALALIGTGIAVLLAALWPAVVLSREMPTRMLKRQWQMLASLIGAFVVGYLVYLVLFIDRHDALRDLLPPAIFLCGAAFVLLVTRLALATAHSVQRLAALEQETITDALTGLRNRRFLDLRLAEEISRAARYGSPVSVLLLDIDHFKSVNDTCGHAVGDRVLIEVARRVRETVRNTDIAARYGGEEMAVIAPQTPLSTAVMLGERLRRNIEDQVAAAVPEVAVLGRAITVSIGVAKSANPPESASKLLWRADSALYEAKGAGRNRVVADSPEGPKKSSV